MTHLGCYDDTADIIENVCETFDLTEPELVDMMLESFAYDSDQGEIGEFVKSALERK